MRALFSQSLIPYLLGILASLLIAGGILSQFISSYLILGSVLVLLYIVLITMLLNIHDKYIKPIGRAVQTVNQLVKGNYRARMHYKTTGKMGELSRKINVLARNLSELSIHEQLQSDQLSTVIDNTESGLVLIDEKGYVHLVNRKFLSMFGKTERDYVGYLYYEVFKNELIHEAVQQTFLYEKNIKQSFTHKNKSIKRYIEMVGAPIFDERNMLKGAVLAFYDITELKTLEVMRKDFVANVSHELKTPITSIKGFAETLLEGELSDEHEKEHFLKIIYDESERLQFLIEDLLTLSKLERESFQLRISMFDLPSLVEEIIPMFEYRAHQEEITLHVEMVEGIQIMADREKIRQIFSNLLANAMSYTPSSGEVTLKVKEEGNQIHIIVQDTGIGIKEEDLPRIFERFYRVDKDRSRHTGGTGLGLAIVKHIVETHHGEISVESEVNRGSTFHVLLPKDHPKTAQYQKSS